MPLGRSEPIFSNGEPSSARVYSPELQPLMQSLLATLANIDFEYELDVSKLNRNSIDASLKARVSEKLKERHRERRDPYVRQLAGLEQRIATALTKG
jgi:hypothetical protein